MQYPTRRSALAVPGALLLSLVLAGQVLATSWSGPIPLTSSGGGFAEDVVSLGGSTAVAGYLEWNGSWYNVTVRRTTDGGATWAAPQILSTNGYPMALSGRGSFVDIVWTENNRVRYARSTNGGVSYGAAMALTGGSQWKSNLSVARGPNGLVIVGWQNYNAAIVKARVSMDGGVSFGPTVTISPNVDLGTSVAAGNGVVYVAYALDYSTLQVKRSTDGGATWTTCTITTSAFAVLGNFAITAEGRNAFLAYTVDNAHYPAWGAVKVRRTTNKGASWSSEANLAAPRWKTWEPDISLQNGVAHAVFTRRGTPNRVYYRRSSDGVTWTAPELVVSGGYEASVARASKVIVLYRVGTGNAFVKTGTP